MTTGIFPEAVAGGVEIRDAAGNPINPPNVQNAYVPSAAFLSTCNLTALPSDCTARIEARQINAIVSELVSFAECMDPNGPWDCASLRNLCAAFTAWAAIHIAGVLVGDMPPASPGENQLWWSSRDGFLYIWYNDSTSTQWVQVVGSNVVVDGVSIVGAGITGDPYNVGLVDCGSY